MSTASGVDILMVTHNRPRYTRLSLARLLDSCDDSMRVWVWHNGCDAETLGVVESMRDHPRLFAFHHSRENRLLRAPTNWLFGRARGELLGLVNDDCVVTEGWAHTMRAAHEAVPEFGVTACWHFPAEDFSPDLADRKTRTFAGGHRLMVNPWVQGSGVMIKRRCVSAAGPLRVRERGLTRFCIRVARAGWVNGWHVPLVLIEHLDDPRSSRSGLATDADLSAHPPLSARYRNTWTIEEWIAQIRSSARLVQQAPTDPRRYTGLRTRMRRSWERVRRCCCR